MPTLLVSLLVFIVSNMDFQDFDERTEVIDFSELKEKHFKFDSNADVNLNFPESKSAELLPASDDPTRMFQYPLVSVVNPPTGVPHQAIKEMWCQSGWYVKLRSIFLVSECVPFQCSTIHGFLGLYNERLRHLTTGHPYMIHPFSDFITYWNLFLGIILSINVIYSPYYIAFDPITFVTSKTLLYINFFVTSALLLDILIHFITGIRDKYSGRVELDPRVVARFYISGWFIFHVVTRAPIDAILIYHLSEDQKRDKTQLTLIRIIGLTIRTLRYEKIYFVLRRVSEMFRFKSLILPWILKLAILMLYSIHWMACFHWLIPDIGNSGLENPKPMSWITWSDLWNKPRYHQYISSYLRSLSNLLTLDGGKFIPRETEEIFVTMIGIFLNISLFGYFISSFSILMSEINASVEKYEQTYELIESYLTFRKIPRVLQRKVLIYFEKKHRGHMFSDATLIATLSPALRTEISCHNCRNLVEKVPLFKKIPVSVLVDLVQKLDYDIFVVGDVLMTAGTRGDRMFFIQSGEVSMLDFFGEKVNSLSDGEYFGEMALITNEKWRNTAVAKVPCEIYTLSRDNFRDTVSTTPELFDRIVEAAHEKLEAERKAAEEEASRAEKLRNWKLNKKELEELIKQRNRIVIDFTGIELVGGVDEEEEKESQSVSPSEVLNPQDSKESQIQSIINPPSSTTVVLNQLPLEQEASRGIETEDDASSSSSSSSESESDDEDDDSNERGGK